MKVHMSMNVARDLPPSTSFDFGFVEDAIEAIYQSVAQGATESVSLDGEDESLSTARAPEPHHRELVRRIHRMFKSGAVADPMRCGTSKIMSVRSWAHSTIATSATLNSLNSPNSQGEVPTAIVHATGR